MNLKAKDEAQLIREWGLQIGDRVVLKREGLKGTVRFIGATHFTFGVVVGLEMAGNGHGNHCGDSGQIGKVTLRRVLCAEFCADPPSEAVLAESAGA